MFHREGQLQIFHLDLCCSKMSDNWMFYFLYSFKQITNLIKSTKIYCDVLMLDHITGEEKHQFPIRTVQTYWLLSGFAAEQVKWTWNIFLYVFLKGICKCLSCGMLVPLNFFNNQWWDDSFFQGLNNPWRSFSLFNEHRRSLEKLVFTG